MFRHALWTALVLVACDAPAPPADAGPGDANDLTLVPPTLPTAPDVPHATCPTGWSMTDNPVACEPWPAGHRPVCAAGQRLAAGACVMIADDCASVPPEVASGAAYVLSGSTAGDGSMARPFGTIDEALASGATNIALGAGTYDLPASVQRATISGACPTSTTLVVGTSTTVGDLTLRRLRLTGTGGLVGDSLHTLALDRIEITALTNGIVVGGSLHVTGVEMHDVPAGFAARGAQDVTFEDVSIEHVYGSALAVSSATSIQLRRVIIADMTASDARASAILVDGTGSLAIDTLAIERAGGNGMLANVHAMSAQHVMVREVAAIALGFQSDAMAPLALSEAWVTTTGGGGIVFGRGTHRASDLVVRDVQAAGVAAVQGDATLSRVWIDGAIGQGIDASSAQLTLSDVSVRDVGPQQGVHGTGGALLAEDHSIVHVSRAHFETTQSYGVGLTGQAMVDIADVEVANVSATSTTDGYGVVMNGSSTLTLTRALVHDVVSTAVLVQGGTLSASDLTIRHVTSADDTNGIGVCASVEEAGDPPSALTLARTDVSDVTRWGVLISGRGAVLEANDVSIRDVHQATCCDDARGGAALVIHDGALAHVDRFLASGAEEAGFIATAGVTASLEHGQIRDNLVGMIASPTLSFNTGIFPGLLFHDVILDGNRTDRENTDTSVSAPSIALLR